MNQQGKQAGCDQTAKEGQIRQDQSQNDGPHSLLPRHDSTHDPQDTIDANQECYPRIGFRRSLQRTCERPTLRYELGKTQK